MMAPPNKLKGLGKAANPNLFVKGKSGNPNGRPRKKPEPISFDQSSPDLKAIDVDAILARVGAKTVVMKIGGCATEVPCAEAMAHKAYAAGMDDPRLALKLFQMLLESRARLSAAASNKTYSEDNPLEDAIIRGAMEREVRRRLRSAGLTEEAAFALNKVDEVADDPVQVAPHHTGAAGAKKT